MCLLLVNAGDRCFNALPESASPAQTTLFCRRLPFQYQFFFVLLTDFKMTQASSYYPCLPCAHDSFLLQA